jgi:serine/threonine protein kinase/TolB-like protein/Flp pilus assembly protein TadD
VTPERYQQVKNIYQAAIELDSNRRAAFLDEACANNSALRDDVERLLTYEARQVDFMEAPALAAHDDLLAEGAGPPLVGQLIGPYRILRLMSEGGMGAVYLADRADQAYEKRVAIKLIKRGMDSGAVLRHFHKERQILANLDHPNIGKLLDGGATADGRSYLVMDYIQGQPIDAYCDTRQLSIEERLQLFRLVCSAVEYAHEHQVVHRDIKPSNILVSEGGVPKLLDFGIAKMLDPQQLQGATVTMLRPMTLEYASPEQVRGGPITAATDVYSLGVVLYELLTCRRPYHLQSHTPQEIERAITEEEPEKPSRAISRIEDGNSADNVIAARTSESASAARRGQLAALRRRLARDLDDVVLMALRKEPERRYASVKQLSEDIGRHLEGRPVIARQGAVAYRLGNFITRNKMRVVGVCLGAAALVVIGVEELYRLPRRTAAAVRATGSIPARPEAIKSIAVLPLENLSANPEQEYFADGMTDALTTELAKIGALRVISRTSAMAYKGAHKPLREIASELNVGAVVEGSVQRDGERVQITVQLIDATTDRHLWAERYERNLRDSLKFQDEVARAIVSQLKIQVAPERQDHLRRASSVDPDAFDAYLRGRYFWNRRTEERLPTAIDYFKAAIQRDPNYAPAYAGLADCYQLQAFGQYSTDAPAEIAARAEEAALRAVQLDDALAEAHTSLGWIRFTVKWDRASAEKEFKRALELNANHAPAHHHYSLFLAAVGRQQEALAEINQARELDPLSVFVNGALGRQLYWARQYDRAIEQLRRTLELDPNYTTAHHYLGQTYAQKGMSEQAIEELSRARALSGDNPFRVAELGNILGLAGRGREARERLAELRALSRVRFVAPSNFATIHVGLGEKDKAIEWLERGYQQREGGLVLLRVEPRYDPLQSDPRFIDLLRRIGLTP